MKRDNQCDRIRDHLQEMLQARPDLREVISNSDDKLDTADSLIRAYLKGKPLDPSPRASLRMKLRSWIGGIILAVSIYALAVMFLSL
jgi:hypothetical protein